MSLMSLLIASSISSNPSYSKPIFRLYPGNSIVLFGIDVDKEKFSQDYIILFVQLFTFYDHFNTI